MNVSCSMVCPILNRLPRTDFERIVQQTKAEHRSKGLSSWSRTPPDPQDNPQATVAFA